MLRFLSYVTIIVVLMIFFCFFFSSRRRHTRWNCDWSSDVCSSDLPRDADAVRGAPNIEHFVALQTSDDGCSWTREITATDANHDGHPEYVHVRMLGTCILDEDHDGAAEAGLTIARDFQVWDNDSNGKFNALEGRQGVEAFADPNENGVHEYTARALWTVSIKDANEDQKPESLMATSDRKS